jgi:hypothetical protein
MSEKVNILNELKELNSSLANGNLGNVYQVPPGYFDGLAAQVLGRIQTLSDSISHEDEDNAADELKTISPLLSSINKQMPYSVPAGYFEQLVHRPEKNKSAKIVSFTSRRWFKYAAAAAVFAGIIMIAGYLYINKKSATGKELAKVERIVKKMDDSEKDKLMDFIDAGLSGHESVQVSQDNKTTIKELLQDVSDEELKDLNEQTEDIQDLLMTN